MGIRTNAVNFSINYQNWVEFLKLIQIYCNTTIDTYNGELSCEQTKLIAIEMQKVEANFAKFTYLYDGIQDLAKNNQNLVFSS